MIEILGWITLYLLVGVVTMPFSMMHDRIMIEHKNEVPQTKIIFWVCVAIWPIILLVSLIGIWYDGWKDLKRYK